MRQLLKGFCTGLRMMKDASLAIGIALTATGAAELMVRMWALL
jgi:hypothetical protein